ncbi:MAG: hypothetical protein AAGB34_05845, partial [Planctomycetota bacterium]
MRLTTPISCLTVLSLAGTAAAADLTIADLAPAETALVIGVDDFTDFRESLDNTPVGTWLADDDVQGWLDEKLTEFFEEMNSSFDSLELERDDFVMPAGAGGFALWLAMPEETEDEDLPEPEVHMLFFAEFDEEGVETMQETIDSVLEESEDADDMLVERTDFSDDVEIITITEVVEEEEEEMDDFMGGWEMEEEEPVPVHFARSGNYFVASSSMDGLESALERIDGDEIDSLATTDRLDQALADMDRGHGYGAVLIETLVEFQGELDDALEPHREDEWSFAPPAMKPLIEALGLGSVQSAAGNLVLDADSGITESEFLVRTPVKEGVLEVFNADAQSTAEPPAFITGDVVSVTAIQAQFKDLVPAIRQAVNSLPPEERMQANQMLGMVGIATPILNEIGPRVYITQSITRPFSIESQKQLFIVELIDQEALVASFAPLAEGFLGMVPREFQGGTVFSTDAEMMGPGFAVGIASGFAFVGETAQVEESLLLAANPSGTTLANDDRYKAAMEGLPVDVLS